MPKQNEHRCAVRTQKGSGAEPSESPTMGAQVDRCAGIGIDKLEAVERAARRLIKEGLRLTPDGLIVRERRDKTDAHYELCKALEAIAPLNP